MTGRSQAWMRQANSDLEAARCTAEQGFHAQACYLAGQAAEKALKALVAATGITPPHSHSLERLVAILQNEGLQLNELQSLRLKPLTRMNSETRYPQGEEAPADLYDRHDSDLALSTAATVVRIASAELTDTQVD
jgi:HEPN domain-containing protein